MQVSVESTGDIERKLTVEVPAERIDAAVEKRLKDMRSNVRLDGFRPGKVPPKVVKERYGDAVRHDVINDTIQDTFYEAAKNESLNIAGQPTSINPEAFEQGEALKYTATVEVYPEIEIGAIDSIEVTRQTTEITDADIDKMIEVLRKQQQEWNTVDAAAADGHQVVLDFVGTIEGETFEGGTANGFNMEVGSGQMIPEFETAIIGMKAGDEKDADVAFPAEYHVETLKGKTVQFNLKVSEVKEVLLPEVNAEFYTKLGMKSDSEESFRGEVRKNMERELVQTLKGRLKQGVMDGLMAIHTVAAPSALVKQEIEQVRQEMSQTAQYDTSTLPPEVFKDQAERRVQLGLIVGEIIKSNDLKTDEKLVEEKLIELSSTYEDPEEVIKYYKSEASLMQKIEGAVLEEMIVDWVIDQAKVIDEVTDFDSIMNPDKNKVVA
ncbi:MAG: trigger factor [Thiotrichaceae bacterium]|nr:trigger factor [Thiotrichaceae bacterium]